MRNALLLLLFAALCATANSQSKSPLPGDYFDKYSYTLTIIPRDVATDSADFESEIMSLAKSFLAFTDSTKFYQPDSNELFYIAAYKVTAATALKEPLLALDQIRTGRAIKPAPPYRAPMGLPHEIYARALVRQSDKSEAFFPVLKEEVKAVYSNLDPAFRSDLINAHKGLYSPGSIEVNRTVLQNVINQASETDGKLNFNTAYDLLDAWFQYRLRQVFQKDIETALYDLSPARVQQAEVMIPMRDGIHLSGWVYRNVIDTSRVPAVVSLSPYPSGFEATRGNVFATNGYVYVYVDSRGRRKSEGEFFPYENDAQDYYDIIDWVSKQSWCNGQVVTSGGSYLGFAQWQAIRKKYRHPALKAINPMVSVGFGVDFPRFSQQFYSYILQWAVYVSGKDLNGARFNDYQFWNKVNYTLYKNRLPFAKLDSVAGYPNHPFFQKWVSHPDFDSYWTSILPNKEDYATLDIPILSITGYYDGDQLGAFYYYNNHLKYGSKSATDKHFLLIGPYDHGGSQWQPSPIQNGISIEKEAQIPIYKYVIWWYDWVLKGKQRPDFLKDKVNYFVTGTGQWKSTPSLKSITTDTLNLYLKSYPYLNNPKWGEVKRLSTSRAAIRGESVTYTHDISTVIDSARLFATQRPFDDSLYMTSPYNVVFESEPLDKDIIVTGRITAQLYLTLNVPDADFSTTVYEVTPDNKSYNIASSILRARYRNSGGKPKLVKPGEQVLYSFDDVFLYIKKIPKGNRLRFVFESTNSPYAEKNYGFGGVVSKETTDKPRMIEVKIRTSPLAPSRIAIPYTNP